MGMVAILIMWPRSYVQTFIPPSCKRSICNSVSIRTAFLEEEKIKILILRYPGPRLHKWPWPLIFVNKIAWGSDGVIAWEMSTKGGHFVWLPWQNFKMGNLWRSSGERRHFEAPEEKEDTMKRHQGKNPACILRKSTSGCHRPVSYPDGPMTARYRFT